MQEKSENQKMEKYGRQISHPGFDVEKQARLKNSTVLVAGIGGLGGAAVWGLASAGIGKLILVHAGNLDAQDLNRQTLMTHEWVGRPRVEKAKETIQNFNPDIDVEIFDFWINEQNFFGLFHQHRVDFVIDARHNFEERRFINEICIKKNVPFSEAAMNGMEGYLFSVNPRKTACLHCQYPEDPPLWNPFTFPVFGAVSSTIGSMAALQAIKFLSGYHEDIFGVMTSIDFTDMGSRQYRLKQDKKCPVCGGLK
ncbi:MAG: HesA/MoeB/ThiF family protein [Spirochaetia bacterium]|nr:HesA/MoeB/ThiF family protein [Spirochaetia bacterium]